MDTPTIVRIESDGCSIMDGPIPDDGAVGVWLPLVPCDKCKGKGVEPPTSSVYGVHPCRDACWDGWKLNLDIEAAAVLMESRWATFDPERHDLGEIAMAVISAALMMGVD